jgi:beta-lactamase superfamily II metal-dependent hydrolase
MAPPKTMDIYVVDVEGGKATLFVSPTGESLLIDTGNITGAARDAGRIMAVIKDAGLEKIDHLITTHWHLDHFGAMPLIAARVPIGEFIDHGANVQPDPQADAFLQQTYPGLIAGSKHTVVKPGDKIPVAGLDVRVVASAGSVLHTALPGRGRPNPYCTEAHRPTADTGENAQSIGVHIAFGRFTVVDLGDLSDDKEFDLMCPDNPFGSVDLFMVSHHGQPRSNSDVLVHAIEARVAIMNDGPSKGGEPEVMKVLYTAPGLEDLWQLHFSQLSGQEYTVPGIFIANVLDIPQQLVRVAPLPLAGKGNGMSPAPVHNGAAYWIKVSAQPDGSFVVWNARNGFEKVYRSRR